MRPSHTTCARRPTSRLPRHTQTLVPQIVKLVRTLVRTDRFDFVSFWDFITAYDWIAQALRIYNIPA